MLITYIHVKKLKRRRRSRRRRLAFLKLTWK
jgi:hypothetical protein